eukprot:g2746.t1
MMEKYVGLISMVLAITPAQALKLGKYDIPLNNPVVIAVILGALFFILALYQHYQTSDNVSKAVNYVTTTNTNNNTISKTNNVSVSAPVEKTAPAKEKEVATKKTPGKRTRKKTPLSKSKKKSNDDNENLRVTFKGSFGLRIECGGHGNVFVTGFVNTSVDYRIRRGMYITKLNETKVPCITKIDDMVKLINMEKLNGPVTVTFSTVPNFQKSA